MNICVVSNQVKKTISGIGLHTNLLVRSLLNDGHKVWVISSNDQRPPEDSQINFIGVSQPIFRENQARWISLSWSFSKALSDLQEKEDIHIVHFTDARESLFYKGKSPAVGNINDTYSAELSSLSYYKRYYDDWLIRWAYYNFVHVCEAIALPRLEAVIANSEYTASMVRQNYKVPPNKLHVCYKGINSEPYCRALILRKSLPPHPPRVLFVGTNMQRKGLPLLIQAAAKVTQIHKKIEFWVVGEDKVIPKMKELCLQEGVYDNFRFLGWKSQADLIEIYAQCDIFAMPSLTEAFGVVFLEAMAAGVVVIGANVGGIPEIIDDNINGMLINNNDSSMLENAILEILQNREIMERLRTNEIRTAKEFSVERMIHRTYDIYSSIFVL
jgi:glycosyltransferase involved in cell wall biosynthesis